MLPSGLHRGARVSGPSQHTCPVSPHGLRQRLRATSQPRFSLHDTTQGDAAAFDPTGGRQQASPSFPHSEPAIGGGSLTVHSSGTPGLATVGPTHKTKVANATLIHAAVIAPPQRRPSAARCRERTKNLFVSPSRLMSAAAFDELDDSLRGDSLSAISWTPNRLRGRTPS